MPGVVRASIATAATTDPSGYTYTPRTDRPRSRAKVQFSVTQPTQLAGEHVERSEGGAHRARSVLRDQRFETTTTDKIIKFVNLPAQAIIRIYSSSGVLVSILEHNSDDAWAVTRTWNVRNRNNQVVASGVYFYHIEVWWRSQGRPIYRGELCPVVHAPGGGA